MEFRGDISGLDLLISKIDDEYYDKLAEIGQDATVFAKYNGDYQNQTGNLRNASGYCVVRNGQIYKMGVNSDGAHPEAVNNTENLLIYSEKPKDGLYLCNGQPYCSFVESKGFEVIMSAKLYAERQIKKKL